MSLRRAAALAALLLAAVLTGPGAAQPAPPPARFVTSQDAGLGSVVELRSSATGAVVRRLATFGQSFTNNGLALSPDGRSVYLTLIPPHPKQPRFALRLIRIDTVTRRRTFVDDGAQPAVSPDGTQLAYAAGGHGLVVRDLRTGRRRTLGLVTQLGAQADLLDGALTWLGDGTDIAIVPSGPWIAVDPPRRHRRPANQQRSWCGLRGRPPVVLFVRVAPPPAPLTVTRCVRAPGAEPVGIALSGDASAPTSLLLANGDGRQAFLERITPTGTTTRLLTIRDALPVAVDPTGAHLLYLLGHSPPALWEARIAGDRLTARRRLIPDSRVGAGAW